MSRPVSTETFPTWLIRLWLQGQREKAISDLDSLVAFL